MILLNSEKLGLNLVEELGVDHVRKASLQTLHHTRNPQLTFMFEGELLWNFRDGRDIRLHGGEFCITQRGDTFSVNRGVLSPCYLVWIIFSLSAENAGANGLFSEKDLEEIRKVLVSAGNPVLKASPAMLFHFTEIRKAVRRIKYQKAGKIDLHKLRLSTIGVLIESMEILSGVSSGAQTPGKDLDTQVRNLILKRPSRSFSVKEIAGHFGLSAGLFGRKFKNQNGVSLADFIRRVKCEEALRRLEKSSESITEISYSLGFSSSQYFATVFRRYFGKTPKQFRKQP